jgi:hypothetical protein
MPTEGIAMTIPAIVKSTFPRVFGFLKLAAGRLYVAEVDDLVFRRSNGRVMSGPFRGMRYVSQAHGSALAPKLLGTYERELHPWVEEVLLKPSGAIIDVGSAEGYYAVGFALRSIDRTVYAFDIDQDAITALKSLASLNGIRDQIRIGEFCTHETLSALCTPGATVICDIEGAEFDLLDPAKAPNLARADVLVEIHDGLHSSRIHQALRERFAATHHLEFVRYEGRQLSDAANAGWLGHSRNRLLAVDEQRTFGIEWGFFRTRQARGAADSAIQCTS